MKLYLKCPFIEIQKTRSSGPGQVQRLCLDFLPSYFPQTIAPGPLPGIRNPQSRVLWARLFTFTLIMIATSILLSCNVNDADRCPNGTKYYKRGKICLKDEYYIVFTDTQGTTDSVEGKETEIETEIETETETTDTSSINDIISGLGSPCETSDQCADYTADHCAFNPLTNTGYCSITQCFDTIPCPEGYTCCDCANAEILPAIIVCLSQDDALMATQYNECTCEE